MGITIREGEGMSVHISMHGFEFMIRQRTIHGKWKQGSPYDCNEYCIMHSPFTIDMFLEDGKWGSNAK